MSDPVSQPPEHRVLLLGAATPAYYQAEGEEREALLASLCAVCAGWRSSPKARFLGSVDDDLYLVGDPRGHTGWSIYLMFAMADPHVAAQMLDELRRTAPPLDRYFTFAAVVGRAFWPIEEPV